MESFESILAGEVRRQATEALNATRKTLEEEKLNRQFLHVLQASGRPGDVVIRVRILRFPRDGETLPLSREPWMERVIRA